MQIWNVLNLTTSGKPPLPSAGAGSTLPAAAGVRYLMGSCCTLSVTSFDRERMAVGFTDCVLAVAKCFFCCCCCSGPHHNVTIKWQVQVTLWVVLFTFSTNLISFALRCWIKVSSVTFTSIYGPTTESGGVVASWSCFHDALVLRKVQHFVKYYPLSRLTWV